MNIRPAQPGDLPASKYLPMPALLWHRPATPPSGPLPTPAQSDCSHRRVSVPGGQPPEQATFCYIPGPEPTYAEIYDGGWPDDAPYATDHRMASAGRVHGAAAICFAWCAARGLPRAPIPMRTTK